MIQKQMATALGALVLAGCGGGGTGSGGSVQVPAPTPSIPAAPTPPPSPPPTYLSARDFTQDRTTDDFGTRIERFRPVGAPTPPWRTLSQATTTTLGGIGFSYRAATRSYHATYLGETRDFSRVVSISTGGVMVGDQDYRLDDPSPLYRYFRYTQTDLIDALYDLNYVGLVSWSDYTVGATEGSERGDREVWRYHLYGANTVASDLPRSGIAVYHSQFSPLTARATSYDLTIDWATGDITGTARVPCPDGDPCPTGDSGEVILTGRFDGSRRVLGTVAGSAGFTGSFVGGFYGPKALEIGIVGDVRHATRINNIFVTLAKRRS